MLVYLLKVELGETENDSFQALRSMIFLCVPNRHLLRTKSQEKKWEKFEYLHWLGIWRNKNGNFQALRSSIRLIVQQRHKLSIIPRICTLRTTKADSKRDIRCESNHDSNREVQPWQKENNKENMKIKNLNFFFMKEILNQWDQSERRRIKPCW